MAAAPTPQSNPSGEGRGAFSAARATRKHPGAGTIGALVVAAVVGLTGVGCIPVENSARPVSGGSANANRLVNSRDSAAPVGSAVRDGKFEFQVLGMERAAEAGDPSNPFMTATPQGKFIIVTLAVTNIGDRPQSYFGSNQKLIDAAGREYAVDSEADMWLNREGFMEEINPGNAIQVKVAFDVPPGTQPAELEVHDSAFSGGARVRLQ
ncbi:hypothetical protein MHAS_00061 [Mycolicibacterium hassiacum DSM 44199]|uniref:DUF4352 domain-containing protein n=1 Tax=Mycolicibacterium hassiacum TaxID=46351 RepID=UPI0009DB1A50|nr:DUF4352 domain-containing protein [Mycolicibacterium hassiacum]VCT88381.1 hypothetical protein MHAS_00061 [Mycolicibacterium hassiacum DSM 44199]